MRILIVKTSSLGDIVQALGVLNYLHRRFPDAKVDWAVEKSFASIVADHPLVHRAIPLDMKRLKNQWNRWGAWRGLFNDIRGLRKVHYDLVFDLQGNCKSGGVTFCAKGRCKIGFGSRSVREWPNLLATRFRFDVPNQINIRLQYIRLLQHFFQESDPIELEGVRFKIGGEEKEALRAILEQKRVRRPLKIMVCPGSKWANKQLPAETLILFLKRIQSQIDASFLLMWGGEAERVLCEEVQSHFLESSVVIDKLSLSLWQNLMNEVDLVIAVDSSALHLCGTTQTPSFSIFGPTSPDIFKPIGHRHYAFQGECPYGRPFLKTCPILRSCPTGACIRGLSAEEIYSSFHRWWDTLSASQ